MLLPLSAWLRVVEPQLKPPFFEPRAVAGLLALAGRLPGDVLSILEVRLAEGDPAIDLSLRLETAEQARAVAGVVEAPHIRSFLERFAREDGPFQSLSAVWVEFDQLADASYRPDPVLCARLCASADLAWVIDILLPAMRGCPLRPAQRRALYRCHAALPEGARLLYVYGLQARERDAVRLELCGLGAGQMADYLSLVSPAAAPVAAEQVPVFAGVERLHLSFDIEDEVLPTIGIEGSFQRQPRREPAWAAFLERVAVPARRAAALAWPGQESFWSAARRWPTGYVGGGGRLARGLSHCKVSAEPGVPAAGKLYLCLQDLGSRPPTAVRARWKPAAPSADRHPISN